MGQYRKLYGVGKSVPAIAPLGGGLLVNVQDDGAKGGSRGDGLSEVADSIGGLCNFLGHNAVLVLDLGCVSGHKGHGEGQLLQGRCEPLKDLQAWHHCIEVVKYGQARRRPAG